MMGVGLVRMRVNKMLELVERIIIAISSDDVDVSELRERLNELGSLHIRVERSELHSNDLEPIIVCIKHAVSERTVSPYQDRFTHPYLLWSSKNTDQGYLMIPDSSSINKTLIFELPLFESVYALLQSYFQRNPMLIRSNTIYSSGNMIGKSPAFKGMLKLVAKISQIDCDVLIQGETGTGKELVARSIHYQSERQDYPFVPVNCGAFNDDLLLSELFGHTKGAFTGASSDRIGLIEQAEDGTLFLDEVDSLSNKAQVALLRYLQDREVRPQGGNDMRKCDTRVLAASNKSLMELVKQGRFREDLLFRLDVLRVDLPPLRERGDDIHLLSQHFINQTLNEYNLQPKVFSPNMILILTEYNWPGNIRQLQNIIYRLCLLSDQFIIRTDFAAKLAGVNWRNYLPNTRQPKNTGSMKEEKKRVIELFESTYLRELLSKTAGNISQAARIAKKERSSFIRLMKKHKIERKDFIEVNNITSEAASFGSLVKTRFPHQP